MKEKLREAVFSQAVISRISGVTTSSISRYFSTHNINSEKTQGTRKKYSIETVREALKDLFSKHYIVKKKIQVFYNFKGGTGKTTISYQISSLLSLLGFKVLAIDIDPQAHLTSTLRVDPHKNFVTIYDVVVNKIPVIESIQSVYDGLDLIPSNLSLTKLETELMHLANREKVLYKIIEPLQEKYDFIIIDTNPTISALNRNAIFAASKVNIVCETQPFSLKGLEMLVEEIKNFATSMDLQIDYSIIPNKYESKTATSQEVLGSLRLDYKDYVMQSIVRKSEDMNISAKRKEPLCFYCGKNSQALEDIIDLVKEILKVSTTKIEVSQTELKV